MHLVRLKWNNTQLGGVTTTSFVVNVTNTVPSLALSLPTLIAHNQTTSEHVINIKDYIDDVDEGANIQK